MKKALIILFIFLLLTFTLLKINNKKHIKKEKKQVENNLILNKPFYTNTKPSKYLNTTYILVNKYNYLKKDYIPLNLININKNVKLVSIAANNFNNLVNNAKKEGLTIIGFSGYRSYEYQDNLYQKYVKIDGIKKADTYSARPGYSEHQTGLAIDISNDKMPYVNFDKTDEFKWMIKNSYKYGYILRYPEGSEKITGYMYEPWHYRYVGIEIATYININNITFEEYYEKFKTKDL